MGRRMEKSTTSSVIGLTRAVDANHTLHSPAQLCNKTHALSNTNFTDLPLNFSKPLISRRTKSTPPAFSDGQTVEAELSNKISGLSDDTGIDQRWTDTSFSKKRSQYFEKEFASREPNNTVRDRVTRDSVITIDIKINRCLNRNEEHFDNDMSFALAKTYQKPASCIMIIVNTEGTILLNGTSEPAYHLVVSALPSEIAATKNKRCAHLIQEFLDDALNIPASRGVIRFEAIAEENHATNGFTARQEIENLERNVQEGVMFGSTNRQQGRKVERPSILFADDHGKPSTPLVRSFTPSFLRQHSREDQPIQPHESAMQAVKLVKQKKSILSFFGL